MPRGDVGWLGLGLSLAAGAGAADVTTNITAINRAVSFLLNTTSSAFLA
jgi:hypothetical protein